MRAAAHLRRAGHAVLVACLLGPAGAAHALLLAYEPFEYGDVAVPSEGQYAVGNEDSGVNLLGGQNPTLDPDGFYTGPWIQNGGDSQVVKPLPSLAYPGHPAGVGGIQQETLQFDCCTFGRTGREIAGGLGGASDSRTLYESFLINFGTQGTDDPTQFGLRGHELWNGGIGDAFLAVSVGVNSFAGISDLSLRVATTSGTTTVAVDGGGLNLPTLAASNGGTHLVVLRYDFDPTAPDVVSLYLDPVSYLEPGVADAQIAVATSDLEITHEGAFTQYTFSGSGHVPGAIDEIRWGTLFRDVAPFDVPEPGAAWLLALGAAGLVTHRRPRA